MASNSNVSSMSEDADELPVINSDTSKGSSVSTDMQVYLLNLIVKTIHVKFLVMHIF